MGRVAASSAPISTSLLRGWPRKVPPVRAPHPALFPVHREVARLKGTRRAPPPAHVLAAGLAAGALISARGTDLQPQLPPSPMKPPALPAGDSSARTDRASSERPRCAAGRSMRHARGKRAATGSLCDGQI